MKAFHIFHKIDHWLKTTHSAQFTSPAPSKIKTGFHFVFKKQNKLAPNSAIHKTGFPNACIDGAIIVKPATAIKPTTAGRNHRKMASSQSSWAYR